VCADIAFGLGARIEGWSTRPKEKAREERRRKKKKPLASHHHRRNFLFAFGPKSPIPDPEATLPITKRRITRS
jgi:hypothetical protein